MGRRRPKNTPPPKPFEGAFTTIDTLEAAVIYKMTDVHWDAEHMVRWLYPDHVVDRLKAAYPVVRAVDQGTYIQESLRLPIGMFPAVKCNFTVKAKDVGMLVPTAGMYAGNDPSRFEHIRNTLNQVHAEHIKFEKVREVVRWLNEYATIGAARHYCPWLTSLLPADHEFQKATGLIYREPNASMSGITQTMRACGAIMASALLCGDITASGLGSVMVSFWGHRCADGTAGTMEPYTSQQFALV